MRVSTRRVFVILVPAVAATLLAGCGSRSLRASIERAILPELPKLIGPADHYEVRADAGFWGLANGRLGGLEITGKNVLIDGKFLVDDLLLTLNGIKFDAAAGTLESVRETAAQVTIQESSIISYVKRKNPSLEGLQITISDDSVAVKVRPEVLHLSAPVEAIGSLRIKGGNQVCFVPKWVTIGGVEMPLAMAQLAAKQFNPILDLSNLRISLQLKEIRLEPGRAIVTGTADLTHGFPAGMKPLNGK